MTMMTKPPVVERNYMPLSHAQRGVWLDMRLIGDPTAYQIGCLIDVEHEIDPAIARQAVRIMMVRHEALRLRVDPHEPRQWIEAAGRPPFQTEDFSDEADPEQAVQDYVRAAQAEGFPLGETPLFRVDLLKIGEGRWRVLMIAHHLVADGVSIRLAQLYWLHAYKSLSGELEDGEEDAASASDEMSGSSYASIVEDDEAYAASDRYRQDLAYWTARLSPLPALLFEGRPLHQTTGTESGTVAPILLDPAAHAGLATMARRANTTLHRALMAVIAVALSRRYRRADLTIGMALHRRDAASRNVIGMLAGIVALRAQLDRDMPLLAAVQQLSAGFDADLRHQRLPIDALGRSLAASGAFADRASRNLFDVAVTMMPGARDVSASLGGRPMRSTPLREHETTPLSIYVDEKPENSGLTMNFGFNQAVLSVEEAHRVRDTLAELIAAFVAGGEQRLSTVDGLTPAERDRLQAWSAGTAQAVPQGTLPDLFDIMAARQPDAMALISDERSLTYAALDQAANRVAARLRQQGALPGETIGVCMERSVGTVVALIGILKAGCVYLPLDPVYPVERLAGMIEDAGMTRVLTTRASEDRLPPGMTVFPLDESWPFSGEVVAAPDRAGLVQESRAYIIYTSGSTGRPKGVAVSHRALINLGAARQEHDPIGPGDRILAAISVGFDVSLGQLLTPLLAGATVVIAGDIRGISGTAFWDFMKRNRISHVNSVPSFFESVLEEAPETTTLKQVMLGGEPLSGALALRLRQQLGVSVYNMYGPTEACIDATAFAVPAEGMERQPVLPIGKPLPNYTVHVLDEAMRPVGIGAEGELYIGGESLAEGYLNRPDLTLQRFVDHREFGRLYRTGDRVCWREDGLLAFLGRDDTQVKIRGFRIELGEIESVLREHEAVSQAAVIFRKQGGHEPRIFGYAVPVAASAPPSPAELRSFLERRLPAHMVPTSLMLLEALPLSTNGKLDERALPDPDMGIEAGQPPSTATEKLLAACFVSLLGAQDIHTRSHFFELGGHSLLATQLASRLRESLGFELPIRTLFEAPRLGDLAARIDELMSGGSSAAASGPERRERPARLPLSYEQERLWFLYKLDPQSPAYNIPIVLKLDGEVSVEALKAAFMSLVERHESLRTTFAEVDGEPEQRIRDTFEVPFAIEDLTAADPSAVLMKASEEARRPFRLEGDMLIRVRLLRLAEQSHVALVTMHHTVSDGWSTGIFLNEIAANYVSHVTGQGLTLPPLPVQYADYTMWQRERLDEAEIARQAGVWKAWLAGAPQSLALPLDFPRPAIRSDIGASETLNLPPALMTAVAEFAKAHQATPFIVLSAAWAALMARWTGQDDIVIGAPIANRAQARTEELIGFFVNTIALRADLSGDPSFGTLVGRLRSTALDAYAHAELPFDKLVEVLNPEREPGQHPIFQTMVAFQPGLPEARSFGGLTVTPVPLPETAAKFDLTLVIREAADSYAGGITYARDLFRPKTIARLASQFAQLLTAALGDPTRAIGQLPLTTGKELLELAHFARPIERPVDVDTIPNLFECQVTRNPDTEAVAFGDVRLSFDALNRRVNQLAHHLIAMGVGAESPVGVVLPRSEALVVAALAIMKAGGVYTPVDPAHPAERIAAIFSKVQPAVILVDADTEAVVASGQKALRLDQFDWESGNALNPVDTDRLAPLTPQSLAYIIHTSGSTGQPKGVAVAHAALVNLAEARLEHDPIGLGDRVLAALSVSFDVSVGQLVTPLLNGATVVVAGNVAAMTPAEFWQLMQDEAITHLNSGPAFLDAVIDSVPGSVRLRRLMLGGEPFPTVLARKIQAALPKVELFNMYGPTETCIDATCHRFMGTESGPTLPIGKPLPNYQVTILDPARQRVPVGMPGEIYIGGPGLARGYLGRDDETAERFVPSPFVVGERLYRTGDLGRWNEKGEIEFLGRADGQVKIRGFRIELDEIAAVLRAHPAVRSAAVATYRRDGETVLVAYVIADEDKAEKSLVGWHSYLGALLPSYMLPAAVMLVPALPMTVNGKLDIKALPTPDFTDIGEETFVPPRDELDATLADIWAVLLSRTRVGIDDNFFRAGGHSLLALRLVAACKARLDIDIPIAALYSHQTIRAFADAIRSGDVDKARGPLVALGEGPGRPVFGFHPVGGGAFGYLGLGRALAGKRPVYGVQASGLEAGEKLAGSLDEMVTAYIKAIRSVQPVGPYSFIGHSFGGLAAFEIARRFEQEGEVVDRLIMLDTSRTGESWTMDGARQTAVTIIGLERMRSNNLTMPVDPAQVERVTNIVANNMRLSEAYSPEVIETPMTYILATRGNLPDDGRKAFWQSKAANPVEHAPIGCDHYAVLNVDNISRLAGLFDEEQDMTRS